MPEPLSRQFLQRLSHLCHPELESKNLLHFLLWGAAQNEYHIPDQTLHNSFLQAEPLPLDPDNPLVPFTAHKQVPKWKD